MPGTERRQDTTTRRKPKPEIRRDSGRPGRSRTCNPRIRNPMLYPFELRAHLRMSSGLLTNCCTKPPWLRGRSWRWFSAACGIAFTREVSSYSGREK